MAENKLRTGSFELLSNEELMETEGGSVILFAVGFGIGFGFMAGLKVGKVIYG